MFRNALNQLQFSARKNLLGKLALRHGLPGLPRSETLTRERGFYQLLLSRKFSDGERNEIQHEVDIGCRNGSYLRALSDFFPQAKITGVEVDGGRRYWNLYRRKDFAESFVAELNRSGITAQFWEGDFLDFQHVTFRGRTVFSFFYPFVSENPCLSWGLPENFANFADLLKHVQMLTQQYELRTTVVSAHQGEWEANEAKRCYSAAGILFSETVIPVKEFRHLWPSPHETHLMKGNCF